MSRVRAAAFAALIVTSAARGQLDPNAFTSLGTLNASSGTLSINTDTLAMSGAASFTGVALNQNGGPQVALFDFSSITIGSGVTVTITGSRGLALLSRGNAAIQTALSVSAQVANPFVIPAPGGYVGGDVQAEGSNSLNAAVQAGAGPGGGGALVGATGGGGHGGVGGVGPSGSIGGTTYGNLFQTLQGGSGGGAFAQGTGDAARGGSGGGAIEIAAVGSVSIMGTVTAAGAAASVVSSSGADLGGGGAGGGIMLSGGAGLAVNPQSLSVPGGTGVGFGVNNSSGGSGGGGGRIALGGLNSYTFGTNVFGFNLNGGNGSNLAGPGFAGVITVDALSTTLPIGTPVTLTGGLITSITGSATQTAPTVEAYVRRDLDVPFLATAHLGVNNPLLHLDAAGNNVTALNVGGTFDLNGFSQTVDVLTSPNNSVVGTVNVPAGSTLTVGVGNGSGTYHGQFSGPGTLVKLGSGIQTLGTASFGGIGASPNFTGPTIVTAGTLAIAHNQALQNSTVTLSGGALSFAVVSPVFGALAGSGSLSLAGITSLTVGGNNGSAAYGGNLSGSASGGLNKTGSGTWMLTGTNSQSGPFNIQGGTVLIGSTGALSVAAPISVSAGASLDLNGYNYAITTANPLTVLGGLRLGGAALNVAAGATATYNGGTVSNGYLRGPGTHIVSGGVTLAGVTSFNSTVINQTGAGQFQNFANGGALTVSGGVTGAVFNGFSNEGSGSITVGATSAVAAADFQTYGALSIAPATVTQDFSQTTLVTNSGTSQFYFNGGSRTFVGTPATAVFPSNWPNVSQRGLPTFVAGIDLNGKNATVAGGLFVNNGYVEDSTNNFQGPGAIIADFGSLVKGSGFFQNTVQTINGGKFQAGNSPGKATFGNFVLGPGGVSNYVFAIDDATGTAGPSPDAAGHVSGWGLVRVGALPVFHGGLNRNGDLTWTATPADKLLVSLETLLNPTTVGLDIAGPMDHFDPTRSYAWPAVEWTGSYAGPTEVAMLDASTAFDRTGFANPVAGTFGWALDAGGHTLMLTYAPSAVPEPGTFALLAAAAGCGWFARRRR